MHPSTLVRISSGDSDVWATGGNACCHTQGLKTAAAVFHCATPLYLYAVLMTAQPSHTQGCPQVQRWWRLQSMEQQRWWTLLPKPPPLLPKHPYMISTQLAPLPAPAAPCKHAPSVHATVNPPPPQTVNPPVNPPPPNCQPPCHPPPPMQC